MTSKSAYKGERPSRPGNSNGCGGVKNDRPTAVYLSSMQTNRLWWIRYYCCFNWY